VAGQSNEYEAIKATRCRPTRPAACGEVTGSVKTSNPLETTRVRAATGATNENIVNLRPSEDDAARLFDKIRPRSAARFFHRQGRSVQINASVVRRTTDLSVAHVQIHSSEIRRQNKKHRETDSARRRTTITRVSVGSGEYQKAILFAALISQPQQHAVVASSATGLFRQRRRRFSNPVAAGDRRVRRRQSADTVRSVSRGAVVTAMFTKEPTKRRHDKGRRGAAESNEKGVEVEASRISRRQRPVPDPAETHSCPRGVRPRER
jgi:hypothetical protein